MKYVSGLISALATATFQPRILVRPVVPKVLPLPNRTAEAEPSLRCDTLVLPARLLHWVDFGLEIWFRTSPRITLLPSAKPRRSMGHVCHGAIKSFFETRVTYVIEVTDFKSRVRFDLCGCSGL